MIFLNLASRSPSACALPRAPVVSLCGCSLFDVRVSSFFLPTHACLMRSKAIDHGETSAQIDSPAGKAPKRSEPCRAKRTREREPDSSGTSDLRSSGCLKWLCLEFRSHSCACFFCVSVRSVGVSTLVCWVWFLLRCWLASISPHSDLSALWSLSSAFGKEPLMACV